MSHLAADPYDDQTLGLLHFLLKVSRIPFQIVSADPYRAIRLASASASVLSEFVIKLLADPPRYFIKIPTRSFSETWLDSKASFIFSKNL